jgi:hypothetical protein
MSLLFSPEENNRDATSQISSIFSYEDEDYLKDSKYSHYKYFMFQKLGKVDHLKGVPDFKSEFFNSQGIIINNSNLIRRSRTPTNLKNCIEKYQKSLLKLNLYAHEISNDIKEVEETLEVEYIEDMINKGKGYAYSILADIIKNMYESYPFKDCQNVLEMPVSEPPKKLSPSNSVEDNLAIFAFYVQHLCEVTYYFINMKIGGGIFPFNLVKNENEIEMIIIYYILKKDNDDNGNSIEDSSS